mgnify:CR=1 FL=1
MVRGSARERLFYGLGIRHVGESTAKVLASRYPSMDSLMQADRDSLMLLNDVGPEAADSLVSYFRDGSSQGLIQRLHSAGRKLPDIQRVEKNRRKIRDLQLVHLFQE